MFDTPTQPSLDDIELHLNYLLEERTIGGESFLVRPKELIAFLEMTRDNPELQPAKTLPTHEWQKVPRTPDELREFRASFARDPGRSVICAHEVTASFTRTAPLNFNRFYCRMAEGTECSVHNVLPFIFADPSMVVHRLGDIHGDYATYRDAVSNLLNSDGMLMENHFLVHQGDLVDRGAKSARCFLLALSLRNSDPKRVFLVRGNHDNSSFAHSAFHDKTESYSIGKFTTQAQRPETPRLNVCYFVPAENPRQGSMYDVIFHWTKDGVLQAPIEGNLARVPALTTIVAHLDGVELVEQYGRHQWSDETTQQVELLLRETLGLPNADQEDYTLIQSLLDDICISLPPTLTEYHIGPDGEIRDCIFVAHAGAAYSDEPRLSVADTHGATINRVNIEAPEDFNHPAANIFFSDFDGGLMRFYELKEGDVNTRRGFGICLGPRYFALLEQQGYTKLTCGHEHSNEERLDGRVHVVISTGGGSQDVYHSYDRYTPTMLTCYQGAAVRWNINGLDDNPDFQSLLTDGPQTKGWQRNAIRPARRAKSKRRPFLSKESVRPPSKRGYDTLDRDIDGAGGHRCPCCHVQ